MFFIELTYAKPPKAYGSMAGPTDKKFLLDVYSIESITQYNESTKLTLKSGKEVEAQAEDRRHPPPRLPPHRQEDQGRP